ncbi:MAG: DNA-binding protein [Clostridium sp.]|nr:DNA-binding protein [Clostridium sp.]MCM1444040.1 DNA-binding protein [Candidatus Amulumruptor caecigallinarius]
MQKEVYLGILFDYYGDLLTTKQKIYFEDYYLNNLTLLEISENNKVSRNAVHKQIKDATEKIEKYEKVLKLYEKSGKINKILEDINDESIKQRIKELI